MSTHDTHTDLPQLAYNPKETAVLLGTTPSTVRELIRNGRLRSRNTGRRYIIPRAAIEEYLDGADTPLAHPDSGRSA